MCSKKKNPQKFIDFTPDEINNYLHKFKKCVLEGRYSISQNENRQENINFIEDYKINTKREHEILYIYCKKHKLDFWGTLEDVDIYIKVNMIETRRGDLFSVVVSFHKKNFEIKYLFR